MSRFVVTGASGLLGARLIELAAAQGHEIDAVGRKPPESSNPNVRSIVADLAKPLDRRSLPSKVDAVFHLAQSRRFREFPEGARDVFEINVARTAELLDYAQAAGARHFILASTGGVYAPSKKPLCENASLEAEHAFYAASKRAAELIAQPYDAHFAVAILRFFFIYGRGQASDMLMPRLISSIREGRPVQLQHPDGLRLNPVHVDDAAAATLAAVGLEKGVTINVAGPQIVNLREVGEILGAQLGKKPCFQAENEAAISLVADTVLMRRLLVESVVRVETGLKDML